MRILILLTLLALGCGEADGETSATGAATYEDAETTREGSSAEPASPEDGTEMTVVLEVDGSGDFSISDPQCSLSGASGAVEGLYEGEGTVDGDGVYVASFASTNATFETPDGCEVPEVEVSAVTGISVVATIENTSSQCTTYCESKARSYGEAECAAAQDEATCRAEAEAEYQGSCETTCTDPQTRGITARTSLGAGALAGLAVGSLSGAALGELEVDLTFDHLEDEDGEEISEFDGG